MKLRLGVIGCGKMGGAIVQGLLGTELLSRLQPFDANETATASLLAFAEGHARADVIEVSASAEAAATDVDVVLLAVKPGQILPCLRALCDVPPTVVVSIAAGLGLSALHADAAPHKIVRVMPNTPALVGEGISALLNDGRLSGDEWARVVALFESVGEVVEVRDEGLMHAVTAMSGSGPAFVAMFVEAMADAGVAEGLSRELALHLARMTVRGTSRLLADLHPALLKDRVTSPNGTTIAGVLAAEKAGLRSAVSETIRAAARRSREMAGD